MWVALFFYLWAVVVGTAEDHLNLPRVEKIVNTLQGLIAEDHLNLPRVEKIVHTLQGPIRGFKDPVTNVFVFHGVPYATAPTGKYKFTAPLPPPVHFLTFNAIDNTIVCPQNKEFVEPGFRVQENCLVANIHVPDTEKKKLPVLVYIHGGAFQFGFGDQLSPQEFVKHRDIIGITFNYRLGIHGFLCLGTENAPGNAGLKDQLALLRWVKRNIDKFGGNPDDVTLAGYSSGSATGELLMLSPASKGLFHKFIPQSGSTIGVSAMQLDPLDIAKSHAKSMNFSNIDDVYALEDFFTGSSYDQLFSRTYLDKTDFTFGFVPCVENGKDTEAIITDSPLNILNKGEFNKIRLLYGFTNKEGIFRMNFFRHWKDLMKEKFSDFLPADLHFNCETEREEVAKVVKEFYFGKKNVDDNTISGYIDYFTDVLVAYPSLKVADHFGAARSNNVHLYEYNFVEPGGHPTGYKNYTAKGATHCAQTYAVLGVPILSKEQNPVSEDFNKFQIVIREMWSNFITTGRPVPEGSPPVWPPVGPGLAPHMSLGNEVALRGSLLLERARFWDRIYAQHYRHPVPPPMPPARH